MSSLELPPKLSQQHVQSLDVGLANIKGRAQAEPFFFQPSIKAFEQLVTRLLSHSQNRSALRQIMSSTLFSPGQVLPVYGQKLRSVQRRRLWGRWARGTRRSPKSCPLLYGANDLPVQSLPNLLELVGRDLFQLKPIKEAADVGFLPWDGQAVLANRAETGIAHKMLEFHSEVCVSQHRGQIGQMFRVGAKSGALPSGSVGGR